MGVEQRGAMTQLTNVTLPRDRIRVTEFSEKDKRRVLEIDITPESLKDQCEPCTISITELLPESENAVRHGENWTGVFINAGTHPEEHGSMTIQHKLQEKIAHMENRAYPVIFASGLSCAVERLTACLKSCGETIPAEFDINRYFTDPGDPPTNPFEELTQNYLKFIIARYSEPNFVYLDLHSDPNENEIRKHVLLDRTIQQKEKVWEWAKNFLPYFSVVWDLPDEEYKREKLDRSLTGVLGKLGVIYSATIECDAEAPGTDFHNQHEAEIGLLHALYQMRLLPDDTNGRLNVQPALSAVNFFLGFESMIRRQWVLLLLPSWATGDTFTAKDGIMHHPHRHADALGIMHGSNGEELEIRLPPETPPCVLLGMINPSSITSKGELYVSIAVCEK